MCLGYWSVKTLSFNSTSYSFYQGKIFYDVGKIEGLSTTKITQFRKGRENNMEWLGEHSDEPEIFALGVHGNIPSCTCSFLAKPLLENCRTRFSSNAYQMYLDLWQPPGISFEYWIFHCTNHLISILLRRGFQSRSFAKAE